MRQSISSFKHRNRCCRYQTILRANGFTLIELAVVIAIIAILAAVAIPYFSNIQVAAEKANVNDFKTKLRSAFVLYLSSMGKPPPNGFNDFVSQVPLESTHKPVAGQPYFTISLVGIGKGGCTVASPTSIECKEADFPYITRSMSGEMVRFTLHDQTISSNIE